MPAPRPEIEPPPPLGAQWQSGVNVPPSDITALLQAWTQGDAGARDQFVPLAYEEFRRRAAACPRRERPDHAATIRRLASRWTRSSPLAPKVHDVMRIAPGTRLGPFRIETPLGPINVKFIKLRSIDV